jgi:hypothetical protein
VGDFACGIYEAGRHFRAADVHADKGWVWNFHHELCVESIAARAGSTRYLIAKPQNIKKNIQWKSIQRTLNSQAVDRGFGARLTLSR